MLSPKHTLKLNIEAHAQHRTFWRIGQFQIICMMDKAASKHTDVQSGAAIYILGASLNVRQSTSAYGIEAYIIRIYTFFRIL